MGVSHPAVSMATPTGLHPPAQGCCTQLPWVTDQLRCNPEGVVPPAPDDSTALRLARLTPSGSQGSRVRQPWASRRNPFGVKSLVATAVNLNLQVLRRSLPKTVKHPAHLEYRLCALPVVILKPRLRWCVCIAKGATLSFKKDCATASGAASTLPDAIARQVSFRPARTAARRFNRHGYSARHAAPGSQLLFPP